MSWSLTYEGVNGLHLDLTQPNGSIVALYDGLKGLIGQPERTTESAVTGTGVVAPQWTTPELTGTLGIIADAADMDALYPRLRAAFSPDREGTLKLTLAGKTFDLPIVQNEAIPLPVSDPDDETQLEVSIEVAALGGGWLAPERTGTGTVVIDNPGDVDIYPEIRWRAQTTVTLQSGSTIELPTVASERRLKTNPDDAYAVITAAGVPDPETANRLTVNAEAIPKRQSRTIKTGTARVAWRPLYWDPIKAVAQ